MNNRRKYRKGLLLLICIIITSIVLVVETYAWFVGISTVNVDNFSISISSGDGLQLSLDGSNWTNNSLVINDNTISNAYVNNTNKWSNSLIPISTDGSLNTAVGRVNFYEKASLATSAGGYRLVADQVSNSGAIEAEGYIVFDIFVKNGSGSSYDGIPTEDIFLSQYSYAELPIATTTNYGAANSIRVGFFSLGSISAKSTNAADIQALNCSSTSDLCSGTNSSRLAKTWNIWEPNHASHATNLVSYYNNICKKRTNANTYSSDSCTPIEVSSNKKTPAVNSQITSTDNVDIYDGRDLNTYTSTSKLTPMATYKTSDATNFGSGKYPLLQLAGNSITKVRVYIWLEGQDIDNYDIVTRNQLIDIKFGFTKDRFGIDDATVPNGTRLRTSSFADDSWDTIKTNITNNQTNNYHVGDTKEIRIGNNTYTLRLVNKDSTASICSNSSASKTACGFVVEFADIVNQLQMNLENTSSGGWEASQLRFFLNGNFYNSLPDDLKKVIADTQVVSSHGSSDPDNFTTTDKIFLESLKELSGVAITAESDASLTRQLDYYIGKTKQSRIKYLNNIPVSYWTRSSYDITDDNHYTWMIVNSEGTTYHASATNNHGYAPSFRIVP